MSSAPSTRTGPPFARPPARQVNGLMQDTQLLISSLIEHADLHHGDREILSRLPEHPEQLHHTNYHQVHRRSKRLANALKNVLGVAHGSVVGTLAFNTHRHMECYYAVAGMGAILNTLNPRLFINELEYIINHAEDEVLFVDSGCIPQLLQLLEHGLITTHRFVIMVDEKNMPSSLKDKKWEKRGIFIFCYETLLAAQSEEFSWPQFDERTASGLCYTSGTTGHPKGVLYSHRSTILHTFCLAAPDVLGINSRDTLLCIVPLFHANAWGGMYSATAQGAKLIFPGRELDGKSITDLIIQEKVTFAFGVPTVFISLFTHLDQHNVKSLGVLNRVAIGGSAPPRAMLKKLIEGYGVHVIQVWGMTELNPLGTANGQFLPKHQHLDIDRRLDIAMKAGRFMFGMKAKIIDEEGNEQERDGKSSGDLVVAGPWAASAYYKLEDSSTLVGGYFKTGDVANIDTSGYLSITDRSKDVIKSGGEWISSIDLENEAANHPSIQQAAVIGVAHPRWSERPLLIVVKKASKQDLTEEEVITWLSKRVAKWWVPEAVVFLKELPHTGTGKVKKAELRKMFKDFKWPASANDSKPNQLPSKL